jgi:hypothetical protein
MICLGALWLNVYKVFGNDGCMESLNSPKFTIFIFPCTNLNGMQFVHSEKVFYGMTV